MPDDADVCLTHRDSPVCEARTASWARAAAAEQCPERWQNLSSRDHADACSAQDVQGIVHPRYTGPAGQDDIPDPRYAERLGWEWHERYCDRLGDRGVAGGKLVPCAGCWRSTASAITS